VDQIDRARDIGIDDPPRLSEILVQEPVAEPAAGIRQQGVDLTPLRGRIELIHAFGRRKIGLERFDRRALAPQRSRRPFDLRLL
jgi:hypothetical protein